MTRKDYMDGKVTHEEYYSSVAKAAGINLRGWDMLPRIKESLAKGDHHLNHVKGYGLHAWDAMAISAKPNISPAFKAHGDFWSLAGGVCVAKQAAREAAEGVMEHES